MSQAKRIIEDYFLGRSPKGYLTNVTVTTMWREALGNERMMVFVDGETKTDIPYVHFHQAGVIHAEHVRRELHRAYQP